jgi:UDP-glucose 4-epimerase
LSGRPITVFGDGAQRRDFTFVSDVVAATRAAARAPVLGGGVYNVGGGSQVSVNQVLELLTGLAGRPLDVKHTQSEAGDVRDTSADTSRAARALGYKPAVAFEDGLRAEFEWTTERLRVAAMATPRRRRPAARAHQAPLAVHPGAVG